MTISVDALDDSFCTKNYSAEELQQAYIMLENSVLNTSGSVSLEDRFRSLFTLRNINTDEAAQIIGKAFSDDSALFKHEVAYVLGQMRCQAAKPLLVSVMEDVHQEPMVRHEAAEALAAIGDQDVLQVLEEFSRPSPKIPDVVSDTCYLAMKKLQLERDFPEDIPKAVFPGEIEFKSVDPAPPFSKCLPVATLKDILMDRSRCLFERYRAMFSLRNKATEEAVLVRGVFQSSCSLMFRLSAKPFKAKRTGRCTCMSWRMFWGSCSTQHQFRHSAVSCRM